MAFATAPGMSVISFHEEPEVAHTCRICSKSFRRREHRNRHERSRWSIQPRSTGFSANGTQTPKKSHIRVEFALVASLVGKLIRVQNDLTSDTELPQ